MTAGVVGGSLPDKRSEVGAMPPLLDAWLWGRGWRLASVSEANSVSSGIGRLLYVSIGGMTRRCLRCQKQTRDEMRMKIPLQRVVLCKICGFRSQDVGLRVDLMGFAVDGATLVFGRSERSGGEGSDQ